MALCALGEDEGRDEEGEQHGVGHEIKVYPGVEELRRMRAYLGLGCPWKKRIDIRGREETGAAVATHCLPAEP